MKYNILSSLLYIILQSSGICNYNDESRVLLQSFIAYCIVVWRVIKDKLVAIQKLPVKMAILFYFKLLYENQNSE